MIQYDWGVTKFKMAILGYDLLNCRFPMPLAALLPRSTRQSTHSLLMCRPFSVSADNTLVVDV